MERRALLLLSIMLPALVAAGCGGSTSSAPPSTSATIASVPRPVSPPATTTAAPASGGAGAPPLQGEAASAATGDIPDNQVFLVFRNGAAGYSIKYPEGWTQRGTGGDVTFQDKNNLVHIVVGKGAAPTPASVTAQLDALRKANRTLRFQQP